MQIKHEFSIFIVLGIFIFIVSEILVLSVVDTDVLGTLCSKITESLLKRFALDIQLVQIVSPLFITVLLLGLRFF